ncbi:hypothetical protein GL213_07680 [Halogeometricum borinquense]|uniref:Uncharacterized protein n=1 Tax=Halogeometricum borinquense TaxID=60847 RepID=A0A6C0UHD8_9EURY|nr:DUF6517 family protein [Halogeometricum borinquense]QIB74640.1 hypothetical protein G3I44_10305 [Halogeometricum borinquense]QIQ76408.1 hypothetical protein GL213_07680 [Halogeometricum borinquense]
MTTRRIVAAVLAVAILTTTTGCIGFLTGEESLSFAAKPAVVDESAAESAGYVTDGPQTVEVNETVTVAGQERHVVAKNQVTTYEKTLDLTIFEAKLGMFTVISSPAVEVAGQTMNPIADYSSRQLVGLVETQYQGLSDVNKVSSQTITVQGQETEVTKFAAKATINGERVDVYVHVMKYKDGEDFIVGLGLYPQKLDSEENNIMSMMRAIEHPAEANGTTEQAA